MKVTLSNLLTLHPHQFDQITEINISHNNLTEFPNILIDNIHKFVNLLSLYCHHNQLTELPDLSYNIKLKYLFCYNNKLTKLPDLSKNKKLEILYCYDNNFNIDIHHRNIVENYNDYLEKEFHFKKVKSARSSR